MRLLRRIRYIVRRRLAPLLGAGSQSCIDCWHPRYFDFHVATSDWNAVVDPAGLWDAPVEGAPGTLCLPCFDRRAERQGVDYSAALAVMGHGCWNVNSEAAEAVRGEMGLLFDGDSVPIREELRRMQEKLTRLHEEKKHLENAITRTDPVLREQVRKLRKGLSYIGHSPGAPTDSEALRQVARTTLEDATP